MIDKLIRETRSFRSFEKVKISKKELEEVIEIARYSSSARNAQCIRYVLISNEEICSQIFPHTKWAGFINWNPTKEESPTAYILMLNEKKIGVTETMFNFDMGIASQNIMLKLRDMKYGGCLLGAYNKPVIKDLLEISDDYDLGILIAIGKPKESVEIIDTTSDTRYFRSNDIHYVPKLRKADLIIKNI
ncbi:nitroreductase family protein [Fusobacteria bacterium ZRK30]|nr:nitroreductase family protein [Fusobacteria bacterium ZRK30]